jgi:hypothetical protein
MQPDQITLAVDELNNATTVDEVYDRFDEFQNRSVYITEHHLVGAHDTLTLYRTFPKANGNFKGTAKSAAKFSTEILVDGVDGLAQITAPVILEVSLSLPVGTTDAQAMIARQKAVALLDLDSIMVPLNSQLMV